MPNNRSDTGSDCAGPKELDVNDKPRLIALVEKRKSLTGHVFEYAESNNSANPLRASY
jgi:hypothetical protein